MSAICRVRDSFIYGGRDSLTHTHSHVMWSNGFLPLTWVPYVEFVTHLYMEGVTHSHTHAVMSCGVTAFRQWLTHTHSVTHPHTLRESLIGSRQDHVCVSFCHVWVSFYMCGSLLTCVCLFLWIQVSFVGLCCGSLLWVSSHMCGSLLNMCGSFFPRSTASPCQS